MLQVQPENLRGAANIFSAAGKNPLAAMAADWLFIVYFIMLKKEIWIF